MLHDGAIRLALARGEIRCYAKDRDDWGPDGLHDRQYQPASIDLSLKDADLRKHPYGDGWVLEAGEHALACTEEFVGLNDCFVGRVEGKSTWARRGLLIHTAGFVDPGFHGQITLELKNLGHRPIHLGKWAMVSQVCFIRLEGPALRPYGSEGLNSHYQDQVGITKARGGE